MDQIAGEAQTNNSRNTRTAPTMYLRPFVSRRGTQRHCDHLDKPEPAPCRPRERKIECKEVAVFLEEMFSQDPVHGFWEVNRQSSADYAWNAIACCETFELLVQCPLGQSITLGNLDLMIILESCLEDANGGAFIRKLTSTATCWPTGHVPFRWVLRGTSADEGPAVKKGVAPVPEAQGRKSVKQLLNPFARLRRAPRSPGAVPVQTSSDRRNTHPAGVAASQTAPSQIRRWTSLRQQDRSPGGICASQTEPSRLQRGRSLKERAPSWLSRRSDAHAHASAYSSASRHSREGGRDAETMCMTIASLAAITSMTSSQP